MECKILIVCLNLFPSCLHSIGLALPPYHPFIKVFSQIQIQIWIQIQMSQPIPTMSALHWPCLAISHNPFIKIVSKKWNELMKKCHFYLNLFPPWLHSIGLAIPHHPFLKTFLHKDFLFWRSDMINGRRNVHLCFNENVTTFSFTWNFEYWICKERYLNMGCLHSLKAAKKEINFQAYWV